MNKKIFSILLAVVLTASYAQAQFHVGMNVGVNATSVNGNAVPVFSEDAKIESRVGFQAGIVCEYELGKYFAIQSGLLYATQGYIASMETENNNEKLEVDFALNYLQIPIKAVGKLRLGSSANLFLQAGPYLGYALNGKMVVEENKQDIEFGSDDGALKRFDFGVGLGLGFQAGAVQFDMEYKLGLQNLSGSSNFDLKNNGLTISVSYFFGK